MGPRARRPIPASLALLSATSLAAWVTLASGGGQLLPAVLCRPGRFWTALPSPSLDLVLIFNGPTAVLGSAALMVAAMMFPLIAAPLQHVRERSFARRRARSMLFFTTGYAMLWMCAASGLQLLTLAARWAAPTALAWFAVTAAGAVLWQASPGKQWCLNRCHRRPQLAAFGVAADRDALAFGLAHAASCTGACWAMMLLPLSVTDLHLPVMAAVALFVAAERVERPAPLAWRWRWPGKVLRCAAVRLRYAFGGLIAATFLLVPSKSDRYRP
jgi:predicted metal-binding membrane protein